MGVLISIKPKWCSLITSGKKTVEVRKTVPKLKPPFTVYIYETQGKTDTRFVDGEGNLVFRGRGEVIGEFVCDKLIRVIAHPDIFAGHPLLYSKAIEDACMTEEEAEMYSGGKDLYGWHISDLVIYDKPKMLSDFKVMREKGTWTRAEKLKRAPQSWCYVVSREV